MNNSIKFLKHMVNLLEFDLDALREQAEDGLQASAEMIPLIEEELVNYRNKLRLFEGE